MSMTQIYLICACLFFAGLTLEAIAHEEHEESELTHHGEDTLEHGNPRPME